MEKDKLEIDFKKVLEEKEIMQKQFVKKHGRKSYVLEILIKHFKEQLKKNNCKKI